MFHSYAHKNIEFNQFTFFFFFFYFVHFSTFEKIKKAAKEKMKKKLKCINYRSNFFPNLSLSLAIESRMKRFFLILLIFFILCIIHCDCNKIYHFPQARERRWQWEEALRVEIVWGEFLEVFSFLLSCGFK